MVNDPIAAAKVSELEEQLACLCDLVNSWCRESGLKECPDPYCGLHLRDAIDRLWGRLSGERATMTAERDRLRVQLEMSRDGFEAYESELSQLRVMAGLLENVTCRVELPNGKSYWKPDKFWRTSWDKVEYPTALAAIRAGMGWDERSETWAFLGSPMIKSKVAMYRTVQRATRFWMASSRMDSVPEKPPALND